MTYRISIIRSSQKDRLSFEEIIDTISGLAGFKTNLNGEPPSVTLLRAGGLETELFWNAVECSLFTLKPETDIIAAMIKLAGTLGGRVRGQNFESYTTPFETYVHPEDSDSARRTEQQAAQQRRKNVRRALLSKLAVPVLLVATVAGLNCPWFWPKPELFAQAIAETPEAELAAKSRVLPVEVIFVPLDTIHFKFVADLARMTNEATGLKISTLPPLKSPQIAPYPGGGDQYDALKIVEAMGPQIEAIRAEYGSGMIVFFTPHDINQGDSPTRFVFAHHDYTNRISVVSGARLVLGHGTAFAHRDIILNRMFKFALRSIGEHHYGLQRSSDSTSVMYTPHTEPNGRGPYGV
jgi:predicted Zn-dependent protease